jgi:hypothetical protein
VVGVNRYTLRLPLLDEFKLVIAVAVYVLFIQAVPVVVTAFEEDVIDAICPAVVPDENPIAGPVEKVVATDIAPYFNSTTPVVSYINT